jgi:hypothetical protein
MRAIGFRAESSGAVHWAVVEGTRSKAELLFHGTIPTPAAFKEEAVRLHHLRGQIIDKITTHKPGRAGVRSPESMRQSHDDGRSRVEGVILEACAASSVHVVSGPIVSIASRLGTKPGKIKGYLEPDEFHGIIFPKKDKKSREAIAVAISALEA